ncbi:unnamed protein product [Cladocopium goreaui]|uniref:Reverse transcriptase domain-containing protein n=1 Tax=Cladocopium goreaui TaxID=2562237 RepID=A0A9P1D6R3_9DINO|nr:unnamed protein product [Cladocopium goreaui]
MHCGHGTAPPPPPPRAEFHQAAHPGFPLQQMNQMSGGYFLPQHMMVPPGVWAPSHGMPATHRSHERSRSPRGSHDEVASLLSRLPPAEFKKVFNDLPASLRSVAFDAPDGIITDVKSISDKESRMEMCRKINNLRRERIQALATPQAAPFYAEDGMKIVPMSRLTERHFWDVFHRIPLNTTDPVKWKSILKYLDACPEKPRSSPNARDIEWATPDLPFEAAPGAASPPRGSLDALRAHRIAGRKTPAAKALLALSPLEAMSDLYQTVFRIYLRKLERIMPKLGAKTKENTCLNKLLDALNVSPDEKVPILLDQFLLISLVVRHNCCQGAQLLAALSFLMMLPVHLAPVDTGERLLAETALCHSLGTLNPPTVYSLLPKTKQRQVQGLRIFDSFRSLCRFRPSQPAAGEMSLSSSVGLIRKEWRDGLQKIAAALAGRRFEKSNAAALAAWNLSPGAWAYVARRVDQFETGWRRKRGLHLLGIISKKRRDLCPFVSSVAVSVPWMGSTSALRILRGEIRELLSAWRRKGHWVPIARHAKCFVSWTAPPTLADCLTSTSVLRQALEEGVSPQCICEAVRLQNPGWPVVTFDGCEHIAAPQGMVPWPEQLRHLARWPASIGLPPRFEDVVSAVRTSFRRLRNRCRIPISDSCAVEAVQRCCSSLWSLPVQDSRVPITWSHVGEAREWLQAQGVFVSVFDHNPSSLGVFCPKLVFEHACQLLDFLHHQKPDANFAWSVSDIGRQRDVLSGMANMSDLPSHLIPGLHTVDYQFDVGCTAAADMKDCFRHLPCERFADMWDGLAAYWKGLWKWHREFHCGVAAVWALSWVPKGELLPIPTLFSDVECVVGRFENSLVMIQP